ncbi:hypothetical protein [Helicobacter rodentium]|uniref:hypothetical protein n=1 Tax=Helicobacter rodentium TaxID=59617 RepID=UPI002357C97F|nr:hypothetical protein [Helicobacter rodentium]
MRDFAEVVAIYNLANRNLYNGILKARFFHLDCFGFASQGRNGMRKDEVESQSNVILSL